MAERLASTLRRLAGSLSEWGHRAALIGGLAVVVRARPRFTDDVDALENGERLAAFLSRAR